MEREKVAREKRTETKRPFFNGFPRATPHPTTTTHRRKRHVGHAEIPIFLLADHVIITVIPTGKP